MSKTKTTKKPAAPKATKTAKAPNASRAKKAAAPENLTTPAAETPEAAPAKKRGSKKAAGEPKAKKVSALDAAAQVLAASSEPMNCKAMIDAMAAKGLWSSPGGKTPAATLYSAILREINVKGNEARFKKTERGLFTSNS